MAFDTFEESIASGQPVELYVFALLTETFRFTSAEESVQFEGQTYEPVAVKRTALVQGPESRKETVTFTLPASHPLPRKFRSVPPGQRATLTIQRFHKPDGATPERVTVFEGVVRNVGFTRLNKEAEIVCVPFIGGLAKTGPRFVFSGPCNNVLFDTRCKVNSVSFRFVGNVGAINGDVLTIPGLSANGDGWATAGTVTVGGVDWRTILDHTGNDIRLIRPFPPDILATLLNAEVEIFAGCDRSLGVCGGKFSNQDNFGGFPTVPLKNPFGVRLA